MYRSTVGQSREGSRKGLIPLVASRISIRTCKGSLHSGIHNCRTGVIKKGWEGGRKRPRTGVLQQQVGKMKGGRKRPILPKQTK